MQDRKPDKQKRELRVRPSSLSDSDLTAVTAAVLRGADGEWVDEEVIVRALQSADRIAFEYTALELAIEGRVDLSVTATGLSYRVPDPGRFEPPDT